MPIYEYQYKDTEGKTRTVERLFKMGQAPETVPVESGGIVLNATRVMSVPANMARQWDSYEPSDLPPVDAPVIE